MLCPRPGQRPLRPFHSVVVIFIKNRRLNLQVQHPESNMRRRLQKNISIQSPRANFHAVSNKFVTLAEKTKATLHRFHHSATGSGSGRSVKLECNVPGHGVPALIIIFPLPRKI